MNAQKKTSVRRSVFLHPSSTSHVRSPEAASRSRSVAVSGGVFRPEDLKSFFFANFLDDLEFVSDIATAPILSRQLEFSEHVLDANLLLSASRDA